MYVTIFQQEIVVTVVSRLRNWPVSILFEQWKEFTARQQEFKSLTTRMISIQQKLAASQYFGMWIRKYHAMRLAKQHYVSTSALWVKFLADNILKCFSYFSQKTRFYRYSLHEMSICFLGKIKKNITNLSSAE